MPTAEPCLREIYVRQSCKCVVHWDPQTRRHAPKDRRKSLGLIDTQRAFTGVSIINRTRNYS